MLRPPGDYCEGEQPNVTSRIWSLLLSCGPFFRNKNMHHNFSPIFCATTSQVVQRRYVLSTMLNGDLTDEQYVYHFCPYGCCADETETRFKMSMFVCWALIPSKTPKFARNRWVNQEPAVGWAGLLSRHHNLLSKLMIKWIGPPVSNVVVPTFEPLQDDIFGGYLALPSCESMPSAGAVPIQVEEDPEELNDFTEAPAEEHGADQTVTRNNQPEHAVSFS